ncbi:MAG: hypothetical protein ACXVGH_04635 [Mycobacteriales bacterium]
MSPHRRTVTGVVAVAAAAVSTVLVPLTTSPAAAAPVSTERAFYVSDEVNDGNGNYGLYERPTAGGPATLVAGDSDGLDIGEVATSADGSRVIDVQTTYGADGNPSREQVVVRDAGSRVVRVLEDIPADTGEFDVAPALSPDGSTAVWTRLSLAGGFHFGLRRAAVASGAPAVLAAGYGGGVFLDGSTLLVQDGSGRSSTVPAAGGSATAVSGTPIPVQAADVTVSPDGTELAWALATSDNTSDIQVAPVTVSSGTATVGAATTVATGLHNDTPSFSRDGATVYFTRYDDTAGNAGPGAIWSTPAAGPASSAAVTTLTASDAIDVAVAATDTTAPGSATTAAAGLNGSSAVVRFGLPSDSDVSGVVISRSLGTTLQKTVYVPAPLTGYLDTGLAVGSTYTYSFTAVDRSGNEAPAATRQLTAVVPQPSFRDPTSITATRAPFLVRFAADTPSNVHYTVDYRVGAGTFTRWVTDAPGALRTFGSAASTGVTATTSKVGSTYTFRVRATDGFGNSTGTVTGSRGVVPFDQSQATLYGGRTTGATATWLGSVYRLASPKGYARLALVGDRFQLIGERCPTCGVLDVYDGSTRVATVDTRASARQVRQVLYTRTWTTVGPRTLTVKSRGTAGRPYIVLDGFAVRR